MIFLAREASIHDLRGCLSVECEIIRDLGPVYEEQIAHLVTFYPPNGDDSEKIGLLEARIELSSQLKLTRLELQPHFLHLEQGRDF